LASLGGAAAEPAVRGAGREASDDLGAADTDVDIKDLREKGLDG
jgi:hypothetical protein